MLSTKCRRAVKESVVCYVSTNLTNAAYSYARTSWPLADHATYEASPALHLGVPIAWSLVWTEFHGLWEHRNVQFCTGLYAKFYHSDPLGIVVPLRILPKHVHIFTHIKVYKEYWGGPQVVLEYGLPASRSACHFVPIVFSEI